MPIRGKPIAGLSITVAAAVVIVAGIIVWPSFVESWYVHRLETGDDEAQREAAEWLATHKTAEGLYQLTRFGAMHGEGSLQSDDWRRMVGEWKFAFLGVLIRAIRDENVEVRRLAMQAMVNIGPRGKKAVPALIEAIHDPDLIVRKSALFALKSIGRDSRVAIPILVDLLQDREVGGLAARALGGIGPAAESAIPALRAALDYPEVAHSAVFGLAGIGEKAVPVLQSILHGSDARLPGVRFVAGEVLEKSKSLEEWRRKNQGANDHSQSN